jgi:Condensation domain
VAADAQPLPVSTNINQAARLELARRALIQPPPILLSLRVSGPFSVSLAAASLAHVARCHTALRTYFPDRSAADHGRCIPASATDWPLPETDLCGLGEQEARTAEDEVYSTLRASFDPTQAPLYRGAAVRHSDHWRLWIAIDHLIFDGLSADIFLRDLAAAYSQFERGRTPRCAGSAAEDFAAEERQWLASAAGNRAQRYWQIIWQEVGPYPPLFRDQRRLAAPGRGQEPASSASGQAAVLRRLAVAPDVMRFRRRQAGGGHLSDFTLVAAASLRSLHELTGSRRCGLVFHAARRRDQGTAEMIGFLSNKLILDASFDEISAFGELAKYVSWRLADAIDHEMTPFEYLAGLHAPSAFGRSHEYSYVSLNVPTTQATSLQLGAARAEIYCPEFEDSISGGQLGVVVGSQEDGAVGIEYGYSPQALDASLVADFLTNMMNALEHG